MRLSSEGKMKFLSGTDEYLRGDSQIGTNGWGERDREIIWVDANISLDIT
jgi:hypothetical protein